MSRLFTTPVVAPRFIFPEDTEIRSGFGDPEGVFVAPRGSLYLDAESGTLFVKGTGSGSTGWTPTAGAGSTSIFMNGGNDQTIGGTSRNFSLGELHTDASSAILVIPFAGTISELFCRSGPGPGVGQTQLFQFLVNQVVSALTCTVSGVALTCSDLTNVVSVSAGDLINMQVTSSAGAAAGRVAATISYRRT